jgi:Subtilase family/Secretion system C-terminal sorting domain
MFLISTGQNNLFIKKMPFAVNKSIHSKVQFNTKDKEIFKNRFYKILVFDKNLTNEEKESLKSNGIEILNYLHDKAYYAAIDANISTFDFINFPFTNVLDINVLMRCSEDVANKNIPEFAQTNNNTIAFKLLYFNDLQLNDLLNYFSKNEITVLNSNDKVKFVDVKVPESKYYEFINQPFIQSIEFMSGEGMPEDNRARGLHRNNLLDTEIPGGRKYNGEGVNVNLADDGPVGPHIDLKNRINVIDANNNIGNHGDMTVGIALGAGNLNPAIKGMAAGANMFLYQYSSAYRQLVEMDVAYTTNRVVLSSTSYSNGCNLFNNETFIADKLIYENPQQMHIFSAGNNATANCSFLAGWANITGGYKLGKNVIACGNVSEYDVIDPTSSRGPTIDGRIKPDICANGLNQLSIDGPNSFQVGGGTSAASPGIMGISAQLYQAYRSMNNDAEPKSALIKATLLNGADDIGNPGPDYTYGWGRVNAFRTLQTIENKEFSIDKIKEDSIKTFKITIPSNIGKTKIMTYWADYPAMDGATVGLINDLDMIVITPTNDTLKPWVLGFAANAGILGANATKGEDHRNNMEQVELKNPAPGDYTIIITGNSIPQGPQEFILTHVNIENKPLLTFPNGGESFAAGELLDARFDLPVDSIAASISFSTDSGATWTVLNNNIGGKLRYHNFRFPAKTNSDKVLLKIVSNGKEDISDRTFAVSDTTSPKMLYRCLDSLKLVWKPIQGFKKYEILRMGDKYMDSITTVFNDTSLTISSKNLSQEDWFSIRPVFDSGVKGRRSMGIYGAPGLVDCPFPTDVRIIKVDGMTAGTFYSCLDYSDNILFYTLNIPGNSSIDTLYISYKVNTDPDEIDTVTFSTPLKQYTTYRHQLTKNLLLPNAGNFNIVFKVTTPNDSYIFNDTTSIRVNLIADYLPYEEKFNLNPTDLAPKDWINNSFTDTLRWKVVNAIGKDGLSNKVMQLENSRANTTGLNDELITPVIDLKSIPNPYLLIDVAYAVSSANGRSDFLIVRASTDCNISSKAIYSKSGPILATTPTQPNLWVPTSATQWRTDTISLLNYKNQKVQFKIINSSGRGNSMYVDNFRFIDLKPNSTEYPLVADNIKVFPNPSANGIFNIELKNIGSNNAIYTVLDINGKQLIQKNTQLNDAGSKLQINLSNYAKGMYFLRVTDKDKVYTVKLVK